jgi:hypothetical protein
MSNETITIGIEEQQDGLLCGNFHPLQHWFFQVANTFILMSFLAFLFKKPAQAMLYERIVLCFGTMGLGIWGWLVLPCQGDVVFWNLLFGILHGFFANFLIWRVKPRVTRREKEQEKQNFYDRVDHLVKKLQEQQFTLASPQGMPQTHW